MPEALENIIIYEAFTDPCELYDAVMPFPSAAIKYCARIFANENSIDTIPIRNNDYALIERSDIVEMYVKINAENETSEAKAIVVKECPVRPDEDAELVGIIFPYHFEKITGGKS